MTIIGTNVSIAIVFSKQVRNSILVYLFREVLIEGLSSVRSKMDIYGNYTKKFEYPNFNFELFNAYSTNVL